VTQVLSHVSVELTSPCMSCSVCL